MKVGFLRRTFWFLTALVLSAAFIYLFEKMLLEDLVPFFSDWLTGLLRSLREDWMQPLVTWIAAYGGAALIALSKALVALIGTLIANIVFGVEFRKTAGNEL